MKRLLPASLITFLQNYPNCQRADLFVLALPNGQTVFVTDGQFDINVPSGTPGWGGGATTFLCGTYGHWERGAITSEAGFDLAANSMALTCTATQPVAYPGLSLGIFEAAWNGLFDAATVTVYTAYMPSNQYGNVSAGLETKWFGFIESIKDVDRVHAEFECQDPLYLLNQQIPARVVQSGCQWGFCDQNCTLLAANYTVTFTAHSGSTQSILTPTTAFTQAAGYFSQGVVTCTSGANAGLSQTVKLHASGNLQLALPFILPISTGDGFSVIKGCDKSYAMCSNTITPGGSSVNNSVNFPGAPNVPQPLQAL